MKSLDELQEEQEQVFYMNPQAPITLPSLQTLIPASRIKSSFPVFGSNASWCLCSDHRITDWFVLEVILKLI